MAINGRAAALGRDGEDIAAAHLESQGWRIIERNWRCPAGELDIVAWDEDGQTLVFVEVKSRSSIAFGQPIDAISWRKLTKLRELATLWLRSSKTRAPNIRVDAVGVLVLRDSRPELTHLRGIG